MNKDEIVQNQFRFLIHTLHKSNQIFTSNPNVPSTGTVKSVVRPVRCPTNSVSNNTNATSNNKSYNNKNHNQTNKIKTIINILNSRGVLVYILTSNYALYHIQQLPSLSLVHFISAIIELEIKGYLFDEDFVVEKQNRGSSSSLFKRRKIIGGCRNNYIPSILQFLTQVCRKRWRINEIDMYRWIDDDDEKKKKFVQQPSPLCMHDDEGIFHTWMRYILRCKKIEEKNEQQPKNKMKQGDGDNNDTRSQNKHQRNIFPILDELSNSHDHHNQSNQYQNKNEEWVVSITFVLTYKCLFNHVEKLKSYNYLDVETINNDSLNVVENKGDDEIPSSTTATTTMNRASSDIGLYLKMSQDIFVTKALHLLLLLFMKSYQNSKQNNCQYVQNNPNQGNMLKFCFPNHWRKLESFIKDVDNAIVHDEIEKDNQAMISQANEQKEQEDDTVMEQTQTQQAFFDKIWEEMLHATKESREETTEEMSKTKHDNLDPQMMMADEEVETGVTQSNSNSNTNHDDAVEAPSRVSSDEQQNLLVDQLQAAILELRQEFLAIGENPTTNVIHEMTQKTSILLQKTGKEKGAAGIQEVATLLKYGLRTSSELHNESEAKESCKDNEHHAVYHFPDVFISSLCKACITQETSAVRAAMIMSEFVLPSIIQLKRSKSRAASRVLISTVSFLANDRPAECASALLVPSLSKTLGYDLSREDYESRDKEESIPNKAQCELVSKIIKQAKLPKDVLGTIITDLTRSMVWNEQTVPVLTTCLQKKPQLSKETFDLIVSKICNSVMGIDTVRDMTDEQKKESIQQIRKGMKFSTLFHTFVTKHESHLRNSTSVKKLLDAASLMKTILGKSICKSLKKL